MAAPLVVVNGDGNSDTGQMEEILARHKLEKKVLLGKIQQLKRSINSKDRRRKKEVNDEIGALMLEMEEKQKSELEAMAQYKSCNDAIAVSDTAAVVQKMRGSEPVDGEEVDSNDSNSVNQVDSTSSHMLNLHLGDSRQLGKAAKRRAKKAAEAAAQAAALAEQETRNLEGARHLELVALTDILTHMGLAMHQIPSNGDCLYSAVLHQVTSNHAELATKLKLHSVGDVRAAVSEHMTAHAGQYLPFLTDPATGHTLTTDGYAEYCHEVAVSNTWGGHTEIGALCDIMERGINIIQANAPVIRMGEQYGAGGGTSDGVMQPHGASGASINIVYLRHVFGLGAHYNSVVRLQSQGGGDTEPWQDVSSLTH